MQGLWWHRPWGAAWVPPAPPASPPAPAASAWSPHGRRPRSGLRSAGGGESQQREERKCGQPQDIAVGWLLAAPAHNTPAALQAAGEASSCTAPQLPESTAPQQAQKLPPGSAPWLKATSSPPSSCQLTGATPCCPPRASIACWRVAGRGRRLLEARVAWCGAVLAPAALPAPATAGGRAAAQPGRILYRQQCSAFPALASEHWKPAKRVLRACTTGGG